jgi:hypothetical protein
MEYEKRKKSHQKVNFEIEKSILNLIKLEREKIEYTQKKLINIIIENGLKDYFRNK